MEMNADINVVVIFKIYGLFVRCTLGKMLIKCQGSGNRRRSGHGRSQH